MYTTIQRYRVKLGQADQAMRLAQLELVPILRAIPRFIGCQAILVGQQSIAYVSTYGDQRSALSSSSAAAEWAETRLASIVEGPPKVTLGEVKLSVDADDAAQAAPR
jgi:hypothetical protein